MVSLRAQAREGGGIVRGAQQRQLRDNLASLDRLLPNPWSIDRFVANLAAARGRPIELQAWDFPNGTDQPSGVWIPSAQADYVFYQRSAKHTARDVIIGHELGHLVLDHTPSLGNAPAGLLEALVPSLSAERARRFLSRTGYEADQEAQAEEFGTRLVRLGLTQPRPCGPDELGRLTQALR